MKKQLCILLALLTAGSTLASCGGDTGSTSTETQNGETPTTTAAPVETEEPSAFDLMENIDYGGHVVRIMLSDQQNEQGDIITGEEENGDVLHDLIYQRNRAVEEKYNIYIEGEADTNAVVNDMIRMQVQGGANDYDFYFAHSSVSGLATAGLLYPISQIEEIDLTNPWWDKAALNDLSIGNEVFMAIGDISPVSLLTSSCMVFNKKLFSQQDMEFPYEMAADGKWTIDAMLSMTKGLTTDVNGDSTLDYTNDLFSLTSWGWDSPYSLFYGTGGKLSAKDENDIPHIDFNIERLSSIYDKIFELVISQQSNFVTDVAEYMNTYTTFINGNAYFCDITLYKIGLYLRDMEDDFGILPTPKYDEASDYTSLVNLSAPMIAVPRNAEDPARTGTVIEAIAAASYDMVTPQLFDVITKSKNVRDEESASMVDLIVRNRVFDPVYIYQINGYGCVDGQLKAKKNEIASEYERNLKAAEKMLERIVRAYEDIE
ncbi:MAG: extracellular solute-binding protein [Ruminococcaceae bacterium]|nr:extracellular solute-binding protein [Oscillospiraceae bacterium]